MMSLAEKIKYLRNRESLTQECIAQKAGVTYATYIKIENNKIKNPTIQTLIKIASAFNVTLDYLVEDTNLVNKLKTGNE